MRYTDGESNIKTIEDEDVCLSPYSIASYSAVVNDVLFLLESNVCGDTFGLIIKKIIDPAEGLISVSTVDGERLVEHRPSVIDRRLAPLKTVIPLKDNEFVFFTRNIETLVTSAWKSDGTEAGAVKFYDQINFDTSKPIANVNGKVLFGNGFDLLVSDGTTEGTQKLLDKELGLIKFSEQKEEYIYFIAREIDFENPDKLLLIKTDGTIENTVIIREFLGDEEKYIGNSDFLIANDKIFLFIENSPPSEFSSKTHFGNRVWEIDDVSNTTKLIYEENEGLVGERTYSNLVSTDEDLVFTGYNENEITLLKYNFNNSTLSTVKELTDINTDVLSTPIYLHKFNSSTIAVSYHNNYMPIYPFTSFPYTGKNAYVSDLTTEGTVKIEKLTDIDNIVSFKNKLFFSRLTEEYGNELWSSDGTNEGTVIYENLNQQTFETFEYDPKYNLLGDKLIYHDEKSNKVVSFNFATHEFTELLDISELNEDGFNYTPYDGQLKSKNTILNNRSYLLFSGGFFGEYKDRTLLISSDGTVENTKVEDNARFFEGKDGYIAYNYIHNDKMYFVEFLNDLESTNNEEATFALSSFDGENYTHIKDLGKLPFDVTRFITRHKRVRLAGYSASDKFYIPLNGGSSSALFGGVILISDTTNGGTIVVNNVGSAKGVIFKDEFYFSGTDGRYTTLMKVNKLTNLVEVINESIDLVDDFIVLNDELFFTAASAGFGIELWKTDGTSEGTKMVKDIYEGPKSSILAFKVNRDFEILGDEVFFRAQGTNRDDYLELWKSDGTEEGTVLVAEEPNSPSGLKAINGNLYFGNKGALWKTDGTSEGTQEVFDVSFGDRPVPLDSLIGVGEYIYFIAGSVESCSQVWRFKDNDFELSVPEKVADNEITFYPNPTQDNIHFENGSVSDIELYDMKGAKVLSVSNIVDNKLNISSLPKGTYLLTCKINGVNTVKKIVKN